MIKIMRQNIITEQRFLTPSQLAAEVRRMTAAPAEWVARVRLDPEGRWYERIHLSDIHEVWLISWLPGQATGFHDHGGSAGAFGTVWGELDECVVRPADPEDAAQEAVVRRVTAGAVRSFGPRYVHDVRNTSTSSVAVSVHAYSPPLPAMTRYDLTPGGLVAAATEGAGDW
jgi:predicted metal-dependent enzyme (double-stranded beta helix superfamily)